MYLFWHKVIAVDIIDKDAKLHHLAKSPPGFH